MHADLEAIVAADEEGRSRVTLAEERRTRDVSAATAERDALIETRRTAEQESLDRELQAIRDDGARRLAGLRDQQKTYLTALAEAADARFDDAVTTYRRIVWVTS